MAYTLRLMGSQRVFTLTKSISCKRKSCGSLTQERLCEWVEYETNKAVAHTVTHELAHATWNANMTGANQKAAGKEVNKLFKSWKKDNKKSGYGKYAETNVSEFWAETVTKAIHGKSDKYTKKVKEICKKYKL